MDLATRPQILESPDVIINPYIFAAAGGSTLLLDESGLGSALGAWSISRKLRSAYAGSCIRVRESGAQAEADIGFSSGVLDTAALASHCGSNNGFIVTIYDQSGNGENITQSTTGNQAKIVNAGSLLTGSNSKPVADTDGTDFYSRTTTSFQFANSGEFTMAATLAHSSAGPDGNGGSIAGCFDSGMTEGWLWYVFTPDGGYASYGDYSQANGSGLISGSAVTNTTFYLHESRRDSTNDYLDRNASALTSQAKSTLTAGAADFFLFDYATGSGQVFDGKFHELVIWGSALGSTERGTMRTNINTFYAIY